MECVSEVTVNLPLLCGIVSQAGSTAHIVASSGGQAEVVKALLAAGADKDASNQVEG